jgi:DNA topoisomerase I
LANRLVIVESPAKAKTINKYLGKGYSVKASMGHVRDLPKSKLGVDVDKGFDISYEVLGTRKKVMDELKKAAKDADEIFLAADPDREGEAICWHLAQELGGKKPTKATKAKFRRVVFHEITKGAIQKAFENPAELDTQKVDAQQARRVLDRLVGYKVSPILWDKVRRGLSAGRVQSVALRLICERDREIKAFVPEEYWSITALLDGGVPPIFPAGLSRKNGEKIEVTSEEQAKQVRADLEKAAYVVSKITRKERKRYPVPPFITSKLQQDAFRKLRFPVKKTMQVAQKLYEGLDVGPQGSVGLITYMRTDSTRVSDDAIVAVRGHIGQAYGEDYLPEKAIVYKTKGNAQDAHEAIRPTDLTLTPNALRKHLGKDEIALYELIWNRFVASQMKPAVFDETAVEISAADYLLRARGQVMKFKGFLAVYEESMEEVAKAKAKKVEEQGGPAASEADQEPEAKEGLPPLEEGQKLKLQKLDTDQHFTEPPPRFSEASLVKELEENGIGRPSTYASIIATIEARDYIEKREGRLWPTEIGFLVTDLLVENFADIVNVEYTAAMEQELDEIEEGKDTLLNTLNQFWKKFEKDLKTASKKMRSVKGVEEKTDEICDKCGSGMVMKWGRYGRFLACSNYPDCKTTRQLAGASEGAPDVSEEALAQPCPEHTENLIPRKGRFGYFLACPKYPDCKYTKKLVRGAEGRLELEKLRPIENEFCPDCKKPLAWRKGRFGNFIACSDYPTCKYIKKKEAKDIGLLCPQCNEGQVVQRKGRFGKPFYGCRRYPQCKFTAYHRPIAEPCPKCAKPYLLQKDTKKQGWIVGCSDDECGYERPMDGPPDWFIADQAAAAAAEAEKEKAAANA